jgi:hypothetical protein
MTLQLYSILNFLIYEENLIFFFISAALSQQSNKAQLQKKIKLASKTGRLNYVQGHIVNEKSPLAVIICSHVSFLHIRSFDLH